jgi:hypothetical protein
VLFKDIDPAEDPLLNQTQSDFLEMMSQHLNPDELTLLLQYLDKDIPSTPRNKLTSADYVKDIMKYFSVETRRALTVSKRAHIVKAVFTAAIVRHSIKTDLLPLPSPQILRKYSFCIETDYLFIPDRVEVVHLLGFMRSLKVLLSLGIDGVSNKTLVMNVCSLLEGSGKLYATGGAPSKAARRRHFIQEDIIQATSLLGKRSCPSTDGSEKKVPHSRRPVGAPKKRGRPARKYCASGHSPESLDSSTSTVHEKDSSCRRDLFSEETNTSLSYFGSHDECLALPFASEELLVFDAFPLPQMPSCPAPVDAAPASFAFPLATSHMYHPDNMWSCSFDAFCDLILPPVPVPVPQQVVGNPSLF